MTEYTTTLVALRAASACQRGYDLIADHVGHECAGNIPLETILDVNGLNDCIWALRATEGSRELAVVFAIYCAELYYTEPDWVRWATDWMSGADRSRAAAYAAAVVGEVIHTRGAADVDTPHAAAAPARAGGAAARAAAEGEVLHIVNAAAAAARAARAAAEEKAIRSARYAAYYTTEVQRQTEILRKLVRGE